MLYFCLCLFVFYRFCPVHCLPLEIVKGACFVVTLHLSSLVSSVIVPFVAVSTFRAEMSWYYYCQLRDSGFAMLVCEPTTSLLSYVIILRNASAFILSGFVYLVSSRSLNAIQMVGSLLLQLFSKAEMLTVLWFHRLLFLSFVGNVGHSLPVLLSGQLRFCEAKRCRVVILGLASDLYVFIPLPLRPRWCGKLFSVINAFWCTVGEERPCWYTGDKFRRDLVTVMIKLQVGCIEMSTTWHYIWVVYRVLKPLSLRVCLWRFQVYHLGFRVVQVAFCVFNVTEASPHWFQNFFDLFLTVIKIVQKSKRLCKARYEKFGNQQLGSQ